MEIQIILALAALGCCTGFLAGLLGIGGGMVLTPFLTLLLGYAGIPIEHIVHVAIAFFSTGVIDKRLPRRRMSMSASSG